MAKLYIFGIGGTGSRVLRSLTMMLAAGVSVDVDEIVPIVIDPDQSNADLTRTVTLINEYAQIHNKLTFAGENNNTFFKTRIERILNNYTLVIKDTNDKEFRQFIELSSMNMENQAMAQMLFSKKNLNSSMDVGFKGNPNIGSVVLNQISNSSDFDTFANSFEQNDKIFIISSIFGGTGASGFPLLLKTLRTSKSIPNYANINSAEIGAITILPYFRLENNNQSEIDSSTFISKAKSALAYYEKNISSNHQINTLYYLGDDLTNTYENNEGGASQQNDAHLIEFMAASAIIDFCNTEHVSGSTIHKELGLRKAGASVTFNDFHDGLTDMLRAPLTQFVLLANCFEDKFDTLKSADVAANKTLGLTSDFYKGTFVRNLKKFLEDYKAWLKELKENKRSLDLFNLTTGDTPFSVVTDVKAQSVHSLLSNYSLFFGRINSAAGKCNSNGEEDKLLEAYSMATKRLVKEKFNF